jgi:hypothetical protein
VIAQRPHKVSDADEAVRGACLCGAVEIEIKYPAFWAWHDHSEASRRAHGAAYATYVGCWRRNVRITRGKRSLTSFDDERTNSRRSFCCCCGTPILFERARRARMVDIPRALFNTRTGREPRYHRHIDELRDWAYTGQKLVPLKGYPGVVWERPKPRKRRQED